jgi:hypothetical protein
MKNTRHLLNNISFLWALFVLVVLLSFFYSYVQAESENSTLVWLYARKNLVAFVLLFVGAIVGVILVLVADRGYKLFFSLVVAILLVLANWNTIVLSYLYVIWSTGGFV